MVANLAANSVVCSVVHWVEQKAAAMVEYWAELKGVYLVACWAVD